MVKRELLNIIKEEEIDGIKTLIVHVKANGIEFIEGYVGVTKENQFYSEYSFLNDRMEKFLVLDKKSFEEKGCKKYFSSYSELSKYDKTPGVGAWLSFARNGRDHQETYPFLDAEYFYYGFGLTVRNENTPRSNYIYCVTDTDKKNKDIVSVLTDKSIKLKDCYEVREQEVRISILNQEFNNEYFICSMNEENSNICAYKFSEEMILNLYEYDKKDEQNIWSIFVPNLDYRVNPFKYIPKEDKLVFNKECVFTEKNEAIKKRSRYGKLSDVYIETLREYLGDYVNRKYWVEVLNKFSEGKLNKRDRNNLSDLMDYIKEHSLKEKV